GGPAHCGADRLCLPAVCVWRIPGLIQLAGWTIHTQQTDSSRLRSDFRDRLSAIFRAVHGVRRHDAGDDVPGIAGGELLGCAAVAEATIDAEYWLHTLG